ncbi:O-acetyl-ADP-ribose deacetylase [Virgibacillus sp. W0181]|uniref:O-acetyl-ADP-ribose deacetylase n=1 Tax=Virgibacillus sp. W0181 TaxID=3391581 RepID=UPI003F44762C
MRVEVNGNTLELMKGDITLLKVGAIVNAANGTLMGGGGVDGAIHRAAGHELLEACKSVRKNELNGKKLETGKAVITKGFKLPADWIIHTVGPVWSGGDDTKEELLANCYRNSLSLAQNKGVSSIAFPSISTGVYRFPVDLAARIAIDTIKTHLQNNSFGKVIITLFSDNDYNIYSAALKTGMRNE